MRRTASLMLAAGMLVVLAGTAGADSGTEATGAGAGLVGAAPVVGRVVVPPAAGRAPDPVGTVEQVDAALGYRDPEHRLTFHYPDAGYVKVHLSRLRLAPGDYVTVTDSEQREAHRYPADPHAGRPPDRGRWAMSVTGDTAVVTLHRAGGAGEVPESPAGLGIAVDRVAYGAAAPPPTGREESVCGGDDSRDAVCYRSSHPTVYANSKAVARLLIDGVQMCTAFRVGSGNRLLTNHHCVATARDARQTEVWFNYQCAECGGWAVFPPTKVWVDEVLTTHSVLDFTLFTVDDFEAVRRYGHLELESAPVTAGDVIYIPQHPGGAPARVALRNDWDGGGNCRIAGPRVHGYGLQTDTSYYCDTEGGSSGSPVLSRATHRVVALHHFGGCPNSGVRMDLIYPYLAPYLNRSGVS